MKPNKKQTHYRQPSIEALQKLQKILSKKLHREISLQETTDAYHTLMDFAFALVDMAPKESVTFLENHLAKSQRNNV